VFFHICIALDIGIQANLLFANTSNIVKSKENKQKAKGWEQYIDK